MQKHGKARLRKDAIPSIFESEPLATPAQLATPTKISTELRANVTNTQSINATVNAKSTVQPKNFAFGIPQPKQQQQSRACELCIHQDVKIQILQVKITKLQATCAERQETIEELRKELRMLKRPSPVPHERCAVCNGKFPLDCENEHLCDGATELLCDYCEETFRSTAKLMLHLSGQHDNKRFFKCELCPKRFSMRSLMEIHKKCHDVYRVEFVCKICDTKYATKYQLNKHIDEHHLNVRTVEKAHECGTCGECFTTATQLLNHKLGTHLLLADFECYMCKTKFHSLKASRRHLTEKHQQNLKCAVCNEKYTAWELERHTCSGLESLDCGYCTQTFDTTKSLLQHLGNCNGDKLTYKCRYCHEYFFMESLTQRHTKQHEDNSAFVCEICQKSFAKKTLLKLHEKRHQAISREYSH